MLSLTAVAPAVAHALPGQLLLWPSSQSSRALEQRGRLGPDVLALWDVSVGRLLIEPAATVWTGYERRVRGG